MAKFGYTGPADGYPGVNTWKGVQQYLKANNVYSGPIDGTPGTNTYNGIQLMAQHGGYEGPIDGDPGLYTWRGFDMTSLVRRRSPASTYGDAIASAASSTSTNTLPDLPG